MSAEVRLRRLQQLVLDPGFLGLEPLLDLLLGVHQELGASDLAQEQHVADFLQWGECLPLWEPHVEGRRQGRGRRRVWVQGLILDAGWAWGKPPTEGPSIWAWVLGWHISPQCHPGRAEWGHQRAGSHDSEP